MWLFVSPCVCADDFYNHLQNFVRRGYGPKDGRRFTDLPISLARGQQLTCIRTTHIKEHS